jgi:hypothetical protein
MRNPVESYQIAVESEIFRWKGFSKALRIEERKAFEEMMDACRNYASATGNAAKFNLFDLMVLSMLLNQHTHLQRLKKELHDLRQQS